MRRNAASPSTRQGPLRATQQFALVGGSPSRKLAVRQTPTSSPTSKSHKGAKARSHSETGFVSDRRSPTPNFKVEKPKALRAGGSLDNINLYLSGQWPKDGCTKHKSQDSLTNNGLNNSAHASSTQSYYSDGTFKKDEQTQTPDEWEDGDSKRLAHNNRFVLYKRSKSVGSGDNWNLKSKEIKARLQRKEVSSRMCQSSQRFSPVPIISSSLSQYSSQPIKIPIPTHENGVLRGTPGKARASVEGLNQEIEKLIISATSGLANEDDILPHAHQQGCYFEYPDGHRAPVPESLKSRSVDTQTPSHSELMSHGEGYLEPINDYSGGRSSSRASTDTEDSRPQSTSPSFLLGAIDFDEVTTGTDNGEMTRFTTSSLSPRPNSAEFVRLPPDGAEKLKLVNEIATVPRMKTFLTPLSTVNLQPSERSAFSSLNKTKNGGTGDSCIIACRSPIVLLEEAH